MHSRSQNLNPFHIVPIADFKNEVQGRMSHAKLSYVEAYHLVLGEYVKENYYFVQETPECVIFRLELDGIKVQSY